MAKRVCMGNEAIALGAARAGVSVVSGYPGTPSTEIIETLLNEKIPEIQVQWSTTKKQQWKLLPVLPMQVPDLWSR